MSEQSVSLPTAGDVRKLIEDCREPTNAAWFPEEAIQRLDACAKALCELDGEIRRLRDGVKKMAQIGKYHDFTPQSVCDARELLGCKSMPYKSDDLIRKPQPWITQT